MFPYVFNRHPVSMISILHGIPFWPGPQADFPLPLVCYATGRAWLLLSQLSGSKQLFSPITLLAKQLISSSAIHSLGSCICWRRGQTSGSMNVSSFRDHTWASGSTGAGIAVLLLLKHGPESRTLSSPGAACNAHPPDDSASPVQTPVFFRFHFLKLLTVLVAKQNTYTQCAYLQNTPLPSAGATTT